MHPRRKTEDEHGESATRQVLNCQFAIPRLLAAFRGSLLDNQESHRLYIPQQRRDESLGRSSRDAHIDIIEIDDRVALDARVRRGASLGANTDARANAVMKPSSVLRSFSILTLTLTPVSV